MNDVLACIFHRWVRVAEEDLGETLRYQQSGSSLPRTRRPRKVIEFADDGSVVHHFPGPTDARIAHPGQWESCGGARLVIHWDNDGTPDTIIESPAR